MATVTVREIMTTDVLTLHPDLPVPEAADALADRSIGAAPVVDGSVVLVGLLRDEDLIVTEMNLHLPTTIAILGFDVPLPGSVRRYDDELKKATASTVRDLMSTEFPTIGPDASIEELATLMHEQDVTHVPVVEPSTKKVVGIATRGDLVRHLANTT